MENQKTFNYSFDEITLLANKNINLITNIKTLEEMELIKTNLNATKNDDAFKIKFTDDFIINTSKVALGLRKDDNLSKEGFNKVLINSNFSKQDLKREREATQ